MRALLVVLVVAGSSIATAEPAPAYPARPAPKTTATALWLSAGTSAAGLGLVLVAADIGIRPQAYQGVRGLEVPLAAIGGAALLVGPSLGSGYAGRLWNGGAITRVVGLGLGAAGLALAFVPNSGPEGGLNIGPFIVLGAGGVVYLVGTVYEIATTPRAVERYNRTHGLAATLAPAPIRTPDGRIAPGIALVGRF